MSADLRRKWERVRTEYLRTNPYCECSECLAIAEPLRPAAAEVDHIDGLGLLGPKAFDWSNLQALTKGHHSRKTARESFGF
ncbi:HNH endonuclease signature motif containing protein [Streptomyces diastatochromogenes]|uniref:HNH endonuclease signature motif containing protein n=1 Tax=Streptomyces diastatochromogenes TaxID=42236 RepID=UPI001FCA14CF|nr:HNH endonuclease signature motif containing protein [Streptomyces diastatochromogenes]MCZ0986681.1 HNH endonuclease signature motif containing protein [Streptomyces diastatochromogenes]